MLKQKPRITRIARNLRRRESWGERLMWAWLRDRRFAAYKFRRQHPLGPHILDFFCNGAKLDVEVDGFRHGSPENQVNDTVRDAFLENQGIKVLRFWSSHLRRDKQVIRDKIWRTLQERAPQPVPGYCVPGNVASNKT
ncbi:MAG TPA: endonuclease domain-containing protein [Verrucomicrobiae bacterium]|nr:endonuclease domain-containing protein [Verrucomicrobiae bacterium]